MMGDDMAIRSGGMYGNPESRYTIANPNYGSSALSGITAFGRVAKTGLSLYAGSLNYEAENEQIWQERQALEKEKQYNIENFQQYMADTLAQNKMSFYSSGLDVKSRTARDVMRSNKQALDKDLEMMTYNYNMRLKALKERDKANETRLGFNFASSVINMF